MHKALTTIALHLTEPFKALQSNYHFRGELLCINISRAEDT